MLDALLYGLAAVVALVGGWTAQTHPDREWGRMALVAYAAGALVAGSLAVARTGVRARAWLAVGIFLGAGLAPLAVDLTWRSPSGGELFVKSDVVIIEAGARAITQGGDPYATTYFHGPLESYPRATRTHYPYMPVSLLFGLPSAAGSLPGWVADPRVVEAVASVVIVAWALRVWNTTPNRRLRALQFLLVLPPGAVFLSTSGKELPVLCLMFLALVLLAEERASGAGVAAGCAAATFQLAFVILPFLLVPLVRGRRRTGRPIVRAGLVMALAVLPFVIWNPSAFWGDAVRYPLGLGQPPSGDLFSLGALVVAAIPASPSALAAGTVGVAVALSAYLLLRPTTGGARVVATYAAAVSAVVLLLAPRTRIGYVAFPVCLAEFAYLLGPVLGASLPAVE